MTEMNNIKKYWLASKTQNQLNELIELKTIAINKLKLAESKLLAMGNYKTMKSCERLRKQKQNELEKLFDSVVSHL